MKETFGEFIRRHRTLQNFTLTQFGAKLNLDSANLSKIENGQREFDLKRLELLARLINKDVNILREEFFSDLIAKKLYENNCSDNVLALAEEKVNYYRTKKK
jgi:transcriptional regulator with XRE-family HTH domain